jgi:hypothetical protein
VHIQDLHSFSFPVVSTIYNPGQPASCQGTFFVIFFIFCFLLVFGRMILDFRFRMNFVLRKFRRIAGSVT